MRKRTKYKRKTNSQSTTQYNLLYRIYTLETKLRESYDQEHKKEKETISSQIQSIYAVTPRKTEEKTKLK